MDQHHRPVSTLLVVAAFATVYVVWGSTYLAILFALETMPPFLMAGARYVIAGTVLFAVVRRRYPGRLALANWRAAATVGCLMLLGGNGLVCWAEQYVPSGLAALMIATVPLWLVLLDWLLHRGGRPTWQVVVGLAGGLVGVYVLLGPAGISGERVHTLGGAALLLACVFWAIGSLHSRKAALPAAPFLATAMEMITGGVALVIVGTAAGEWPQVELEAVSARSALALGYLVVFGSILAFTAYTWLLRVTTAARVATYAYVNPVVAMLLGALWAGEVLTPRAVLAAGIIIASVVVITTARRKSAARHAPPGVEESVMPVGPPLVAQKTRPLAEVQPIRSMEPNVFSLTSWLGERSGNGRPYVELLRSGSLSLGVYRLPAGGTDPQEPHDEDEVYYVVEGRGRLCVGPKVHEVGPGSLVYVERHMPHRFRDITEGLTVVVVFAPAEGTALAPTGQLTESSCR